MANNKNNGINKNVLILVIALFIIGIIFIINNIGNSKYNYSIETINNEDIKYYVYEVNGLYGVIDKDGNNVIEAKYAKIDIPNPKKDFFIIKEKEDSKNNKVINAKGEQQLSSYEDVSAIELDKTISSIPYEKTVLRYKSKNSYGLIDFSGKKITNADYEDIQKVDFREGTLKIKSKGKYGIINIKGTIILKPIYDDVNADGYYSDKDGYKNDGFIIRTKTDNGYKYGYTTSKGKIIIEPIYTQLSRINEISDNKNAYLITSVNGKYGISKNKKQLLKNEYEDINYNTLNQLFICRKQQAKGVYNLDGKAVVPMNYDEITIGGIYINAIKGNQSLTFDAKGNKIETKFISSLKATDKYSIIIDQNNNYNIVDNNNNLMLKENYAYIEYYKDDYFIVTKNGYTGIINSTGAIIVPIEYSTISKIDKTNILEATKIKNNQIDLIDTNAKVVRGLENAQMSIADNYIKLESDKSINYYTLEAKQTNYKELFPNNKLYAYTQNGKWGFTDKTNQVIVPARYEAVTEQNGNTVGFKQNGKWGIMDTSGNIIVQPIYTITSSKIKFLGKYYLVSDNIGLSIYSGDIVEE